MDTSTPLSTLTHSPGPAFAGYLPTFTDEQITERFIATYGYTPKVLERMSSIVIAGPIETNPDAVYNKDV